YDGVRNYFPHFDRRHNFNLVATYTFGNQGSWSFNTRWNFGSGFPFTQTQGFYEQLNFSGGVGTGFLNQNGTLTPYFTDINSGRLPYFHRLDMSLSKKIKFSETRSLTITVAATNVYNRANIFYFDRANYRRVDQLPIMPTLGINYSF
ncbi:MAG: TonB-dependent receptor, partial [Bacteroidota bacterium]